MLITLTVVVQFTNILSRSVFDYLH